MGGEKERFQKSRESPSLERHEEKEALKDTEKEELERQERTQECVSPKPTGSSLSKAGMISSVKGC